MTFNQLIKLLPKVVKYNLKIIFAGKFFWFLLAAFGFFAFFRVRGTGQKLMKGLSIIYSCSHVYC